MNQVVTQQERTAPAPIVLHEDLALALLNSAASEASSVSHIAVHTDIAEIEYEWRAFEKVAACTAFQTVLWLSAWQRHIGRKRGIVPCIVTGRDSRGALVFILPLAAETRGSIRRLSWLGCNVCDYNAPIVSPAFLRGDGAARFRELWPEILTRIREKTGTRIDLVDLDKMPEKIDGHANPATGLNVIPHPSGAHVATLGDSWESYYAAKRSAATRKTERKKFRHLTEFGDVRSVDALTPAERAVVMGVLIAQKKSWFTRMGVNDIFAPPGMREFFIDVVTDIRMRDMVHVSQLKVGKVVGATGLGLRHKHSYYSILSSYAEAEYTKHGPGRVHLHDLMRSEIARGSRYFDFTVGDEAYKSDWADIHVKLYDYLQPLTVRGWWMACAIHGFRRVKRAIKQTPLLWRAYCALRLWKVRLMRGSTPSGTAG